MENVTWNENVIAADSRGQHRLLAPRAAPAAPAQLRRAPPLSRHRRGRVARLPRPPPPDPAGDQPAAGLPHQLEQRALGGTGPTATPRPASAPPGRSTAPAGSSCWRAGSSAAGPPTRSRARSTGRRARWPSSGRSSPSQLRAARRGRQLEGAQRAHAAQPLGRQLSPHRLGGHGGPRRGRLGGVQGPGRGDRAVPVPARRGAAGGQDRELARVRHHAGRGLRLPHPGPPRRCGWPPSAPSDVLARRFGTTDPARWREPRRMYEVTAQGAASPPELPFFDRGTWQQSLASALRGAGRARRAPR